MEVTRLEAGVHIICGHQRSGKSHLLRYLMYTSRNRFSGGGIVFSPEAMDFVPDEWIHESYSDAALAKWLAARDRKGLSFCIIDGVDGLRSKGLETPAYKAQQDNVALVIVTQSIRFVPSRIRAAACRVYTFGTAGDIEGLRNLMCPSSSLSDFANVLQGCTSGPYHFVAANAECKYLSKFTCTVCPAEIPAFSLRPDMSQPIVIFRAQLDAHAAASDAVICVYKALVAAGVPHGEATRRATALHRRMADEIRTTVDEAVARCPNLPPQ